MFYLYLLTILALLISVVKDKDKTVRALRIAFKKFRKIAPAFITVLLAVSIVLFLVPDRMILHYLGGDNQFGSFAIAIGFGSTTLIPGFIAFPLAGILLHKGVSYMVLSAFTTTLMMVGVLTFPVERQYLGTKAAVLRNLLGLATAVVVALCVGVVFGELL